MPIKQEEVRMIKEWIGTMFQLEGQKYWKYDPGVTLEAYCSLVDQGKINDKDFAIESKLSKYRYAKITPQTLHKCIEDIATSCNIGIEEFLVFANWSPSTLKIKLGVGSNGYHSCK